MPESGTLDTGYSIAHRGGVADLDDAACGEDLFRAFCSRAGAPGPSGHDSHALAGASGGLVAESGFPVLRSQSRRAVLARYRKGQEGWSLCARRPTRSGSGTVRALGVLDNGLSDE